MAVSVLETLSRFKDRLDDLLNTIREGDCDFAKQIVYDLVHDTDDFINEYEKQSLYESQRSETKGELPVFVMDINQCEDILTAISDVTSKINDVEESVGTTCDLMNAYLTDTNKLLSIIADRLEE